MHTASGLWVRRCVGLSGVTAWTAAPSRTVLAQCHDPLPDCIAGCPDSYPCLRLDSVSVVSGLDGEDAVGEDSDALPEFFGSEEGLAF